MLYAELLQCPSHLCRTIFVHFTSNLRREEIMASPVGVERAEQAMLADGLMDAAETAVRTFLNAEESRGNLTGRIIHGNNQIAILIAEPLVLARILMNHHPAHRTT